MPGVPNVFGNATTTIPLQQLDQNFNTQLTIGSTSVGLGNTVTSLAGLVNVASSVVTTGVNLSIFTAQTITGASGNLNVDIGPITQWSGYLILMSWNGGAGFALLNTDNAGNINVIASSQSRGGQSSFDTSNNFASNGGNGIAFVYANPEVYVQFKANWPGGTVKITWIG